MQHSRSSSSGSNNSYNNKEHGRMFDIAVSVCLKVVARSSSCDSLGLRKGHKLCLSLCACVCVCLCVCTWVCVSVGYSVSQCYKLRRRQAVAATRTATPSAFYLQPKHGRTCRMRNLIAQHCKQRANCVLHLSLSWGRHQPHQRVTSPFVRQSRKRQQLQLQGIIKSTGCRLSFA